MTSLDSCVTFEGKLNYLIHRSSSNLLDMSTLNNVEIIIASGKTWYIRTCTYILYSWWIRVVITFLSVRLTERIPKLGWPCKISYVFHKYCPSTQHIINP